MHAVLNRINYSRKQSTGSPGFTIVELLIVIVVIGILVLIGIISYNGLQNKAIDKGVVSDLDGISSALTNYQVTHNGQLDSTVAWYSPSGANTAIAYTPTSGDTIDVVVNTTDYCIRGFNPLSASYKTLATAATKESTPGACATLPPSLAATSGMGCPSGFIIVPGSGLYGTSNFCVMKYDAKNVGGIATSQASGAPWVSINQTDATTAGAAACTGCHLITEAEWLTIAQNVLNVASNWSGGSVGTGYIYSGHNDGTQSGGLPADTNDANGYSGETNQGGNQRRTLTLSNGQVIWDFAGNVWQWTQGTLPNNQQPGLSSDSVVGPKEWNNSSLILGGLPSSDLPSYGTPAASAWTSAQGIGLLYSNKNATGTTTEGFLRGGSWGSSTYAGIYYLAPGNPQNSTDISMGFRVSK
jgi:prepilin-type N-terminal cleavage/methylation domain-containing protein